MMQTESDNNVNILSNAEIKLFHALGESYMVPLIINRQLNVTNAYKQAALELFVKGIGESCYDKQVANALRQAIKAIQDCYPLRLTPMFDTLITINKYE